MQQSHSPILIWCARDFHTSTTLLIRIPFNRYNPIVFDLAVKRAIRDPMTGAQFSASIFASPVWRTILRDGPAGSFS
jgi:hypothetical protein